MTEIEKLREICKLIGYNILIWKQDENGSGYIELNIKDIIFSSEFIDKLINYVLEKDKHESKMIIYAGLMHNVGNPVDYIYELITNKEIGMK